MYLRYSWSNFPGLPASFSAVLWIYLLAQLVAAVVASLIARKLHGPGPWAAGERRGEPGYEEGLIPGEGGLAAEPEGGLAVATSRDATFAPMGKA